MRIDRRRALGLFGAGGLALGADAVGATVPAPFVDVAFTHGVASGDPQQDRVILWTRALPTDARQRTATRLSVSVEIGRTPDFSGPVVRREATTGSDRDWTVKVDVDGLKPGEDYWYRFSGGGNGAAPRVFSPVGRTRTLPKSGVRDVVLAVASCSLHPNGYFNAYRAIADLDRVDAVLHLGDYLYEYGAADGDYGMANGKTLGRIPEPAHEMVTLADYRTRHAQYKADPDLQAAHARAPWIVVWDDHELTNDAWVGGAQNHQPETEGDWAVRKAAALKAYHEWMPTRETPGRLPEQANRSFRFGDLATLHMLETRLLARTRQLTYDRDLVVSPGPDGTPVPDVAGFRAKLADPSRRLLGDGQLAWLEGELKTSVDAGVVWQIVGNQIVMARVDGPDVDRAYGKARVDRALAGANLPPREAGLAARFRQIFPYRMPLNLDSWDGYPAERERLYDVLKRTGARPVVLAGDSHTFWANELADAEGRRVAVEFGATAISSPAPPYGPPFLGGRLPGLIRRQNSEVKFCDAGLRGFLLVTLTRREARAEMIGVSTTQSRDFETRRVARFRAERQGRGVGPLVRA
jgi:alkaline phosphatase D